MGKLSKAEVQVLRELEGAPDKELRHSTLQSCSAGMGIHPRRMRLVVARLGKLGLVEIRKSWGADMPHWVKLTPAGECLVAESVQ